MLFNKEDLVELVCDGYVENLELVLDEIVDTTRWSVIHEIVFEHDGKLYKTTYSVGATEYQDEQPFEYEPDQIEIKEVFPVSKTITVYV